MKKEHFNQEDQFFMNLALNISKKNIGLTKNNPSVGCVLVKNNIIISTGITGENGIPHAENIAITKAGLNAKNSTIYVTLEPCSHFGKTAPCADLIIDSKISRVVVATLDPDKRVDGKGVKKLQLAGIEVIVGVLEEKAKEINRGFFTAKTKNRPFITLKLATSFDGKIAHQQSKQNDKNRWISSAQSQKYAHCLRAKNDAILVGSKTVLQDDPILNCRLEGLEKYSPIRIILSSKLNFDVDKKIIQNTKLIPTYIATENLNTQKFINLGIKIINFKKDDLLDLVQKLPEIGINNLLIEGGSIVASQFLKAGLIDKFIWIRSMQIIGNEGIGAIEGSDVNQVIEKFRFTKSKKIADDLLMEYEK